MKIPLRCSTKRCHRRRKVSPGELLFLRQEGERTGQHCGLVCPACVRRAPGNPGEYDPDITLGVLLVESAQ